MACEEKCPDRKKKKVRRKKYHVKPKLIFVQKKSETECKNVFTFFFKVFQEKNMFGEFHFHVEKLFFSCFFGGMGWGEHFQRKKIMSRVT